MGKLRRSMAVLAFTAMGAGSVAAPVAAQDPVRIAALGDSLTQGYWLAVEDGLVPRLQAWLTARGHAVVVLNAGVSGDTSAGGLSRLDWTLADQPDAVIVALGGNDLLRGIDPAATRANLRAILEGVGARPVLLAGLHPPGNYGPEFQAAFGAIFPDLAAEFGAVLVPDLLAPITARNLAGQSVADLMQDDGLHPNPAGVALVVEALGPAVEDLLARLP